MYVCIVRGEGRGNVLEQISKVVVLVLTRRLRLREDLKPRFPSR